jgi:hypothetical protein
MIHVSMGTACEIRAVEHLGGFCLRLTFADDLVADVDLADRIQRAAGPIFTALQDETLFAQVQVDPELGTIVWPNGADLAPDVLHAEARSLI